MRTKVKRCFCAMRRVSSHTQWLLSKWYKTHKSTIKNIAFVSTIHLRTIFILPRAFITLYTCRFKLLYMLFALLLLLKMLKKIFKYSHIHPSNIHIQEMQEDSFQLWPSSSMGGQVGKQASADIDDTSNLRDKKVETCFFLQNAAIIDGIFFFFWNKNVVVKSNKVHTCIKVWLTTGGGYWIGGT